MKYKGFFSMIFIPKTTAMIFAPFFVFFDYNTRKNDYQHKNLINFYIIF